MGTILIPYINSPLHELKYALRSICRNQEHDNLIIAGDIPSWYKGDGVKRKQVSRGKQMNVRDNILAARLSEEFILWYDDLFKLKPEPIINTNFGKLKDALKHNMHLSTRIGIENVYRIYKDGLFFGNHMPMVINGKMFSEMKVDGKLYNTKALYGNYAGITGEFADDVKVRNENDIKINGQIYLSTHNITKKTLNLLDSLFPEKCRYER